jgi:hypothetical protein
MHRFPQVVQLVAQRIAAVVVKINVSPITRIDFFQQASHVASLRISPYLRSTKRHHLAAGTFGQLLQTGLHMLLHMVNYLLYHPVLCHCNFFSLYVDSRSCKCSLSAAGVWRGSCLHQPPLSLPRHAQAVNVAHWMAYHRTSVLYNSNIDTFAICAMFFVIKCLGVKEVCRCCEALLPFSACLCMYLSLGSPCGISALTEARYP